MALFVVKESQDNDDGNPPNCPWSAAACSQSGMTWSVLVNVKDCNVTDEVQMIVNSRFTAAFYINTDGTVY